MTKTAIQKMVEWLENYAPWYNNDNRKVAIVKEILIEARRLAAGEAKEKPTEITPDLLKKGVEALGHNSGITPTIYYTQAQVDMLLSAQKPTAPASLVEEVMAYADKQYKAKNGMWCPKLEHDLFDMASRYRPSPQADIVGELKAYCATGSEWDEKKRYADGLHDAKRAVEEIIAKHEGAK